jgi:AraC family transcriptional regulator
VDANLTIAEGLTGNPRCVMSGQLQLSVVTRPSPGVLSGQPGVEPRAAVERIAMRSFRGENSMAVEVDRLLEDVRVALDHDLGRATKAAGRLAAVLAGKLHQDPRPTPARGGLAPWQKRKIQSYIEDQLESRLVVEDLAKVVSLSVSYFSRSFKQSFGEAPHTYIVRTRVARAQALMQTTCESLSQIALACGLLDQAHLCRRFRQVTGTTPGAWRRCHAIGP